MKLNTIPPYVRTHRGVAQSPTFEVGECFADDVRLLDDLEACSREVLTLIAFVDRSVLSRTYVDGERLRRIASEHRALLVELATAQERRQAAKRGA